MFSTLFLHLFSRHGQSTGMEVGREQKSLWHVGINSYDESLAPTSGRGATMTDPGDVGEKRIRHIQEGHGLLRSLRNFETWVDGKLGVEGMGVERVPEDKRRRPQILNVCT
jgi:hypothetical protein